MGLGIDAITSRFSAVETLVNCEIQSVKEDTSLFDGRLSKAECDLINLEENIRTAQEKLNIVAADTSRLEEENANGANVMADLGNEMLTSKRSSESSKENGNHQTISATSEISRRNWSDELTK